MIKLVSVGVFTFGRTNGQQAPPLYLFIDRRSIASYAVGRPCIC